MIKNIIITVLIGIIIILTYSIYNRQLPVIEDLTRKQISEAIINSKEKDSLPHYRFIDQEILWTGELMNFEGNGPQGVKFHIRVNEEAPGPDTILVTKMSQYKEFFSQNKNTLLHIKGNIVRIDPDMPGREKVYVHGHIFCPGCQ